ncbi:MAG: hypothetical protein WCO30_02760 [bacterium]
MEKVTTSVQFRNHLSTPYGIILQSEMPVEILRLITIWKQVSRHSKIERKYLEQLELKNNEVQAKLADYQVQEVQTEASAHLTGIITTSMHGAVEQKELPMEIIKAVNFWKRTDMIKQQWEKCRFSLSKECTCITTEYFGKLTQVCNEALINLLNNRSERVA